MAREQGHLEIVSLLERADHTSSAENEESSSDVQAEGGKPSEAGSEDGAAVSISDRTSEQTSTEETLREREASSNSTVPSGHILTKEELQVLGALLSRFSDKKLKSIQLALEEEQEIRDISREEVEKSLRQSGLASMADGLKDDIEKGITNIKCYEAYEQALKGGLALTLRYLKFLFFGPPRSGKTSTRRRLIKEIINLAELDGRSVSTGVAEISDVIIKMSKPEDVTIKKLTSESVAIAETEWKSMKTSKEGTQVDIYDEEDLARLFYQLIYKESTSTTPATSSEPTPMQDSNEHSKNEAPDLSNTAIVPTSALINNPTGENTKQDEQSDDATKLERLVTRRLSDTEKSEINDAFRKLTTILRSDSPDDLKRLLEDLTMINMADVGGQPAFLDMLPALTVGPALYLLFFRLDQELQEHYPVHFRLDEGADIVLETSYCIEEVLYQCLASIACFSSHSQADAEAASKSTALGRALLFGTYKDKVDDEKISQIQETLEDEFKATKLYKEGLLLKPLKNKMAFTVDNMNGTEDSEMVDIRNDIEGKIKEYFPAIPIPASWLIFRVVLNLLNKPVLSLAQCEEIAKQLSMPTAVEEAIWFFHHSIGSLMHYTNIPSMEDTVICNPQIIFDSITKLIIDKFQKTKGEIEKFHQRGLFTLSHIQDTTKHPQSSLLKLNQLVDVLKHHNVLVEVKQEDTRSEPKFIMPAVMKYASESELLSPSSTLEATPSPIFIYFAGGFVPFGVFCAGVVHLIAQLDSMSPGWQLCDDQVMRNKAKFIIDKAFFATLISRPQYIMIHIEKRQKARCKTALEVICSKVRKTVVQALETVILNMKYKPYGTLQVSIEQPFELAFACNLEDSHSNHFMIVTKDDNGHHTKCLKSQVHFDLEDRHLIWFKDKNGTSSSETDIQFECAHNKDEQNANSGPHSEPLASSSTLNDQHSTPPESDVALDTHLTFSSSMSDEDFFKWLRSKGISDKDCKVLSDNGITPSGFRLCDVEDFDNIGLTIIGKKLFLRIFTEVKGQHGDQQPSERDRSHDGSRGHAPQHSGQMDGSNEGTVYDELPTLDELLILKYADEGRRHKLRIIKEASHKWKDITSLICGDANVMTKLEDKYHGDPNECLKQTFIEYFINKKPQGYTQNWNGLIELLDDVDLEPLAEKVKHALFLESGGQHHKMNYPSGASVQQPQSPPTVQTPVDVSLQSLTFSKDMSNEQLAMWLRNHPSLRRADYEEDISKLRDARINGHVFLSLNESRLERFHVSVGFEFAIMDIIEYLKSSHQPPSSERLPLQQQSLRSNVATPRTTQHQLNSSTAGQQTKLGFLGPNDLRRVERIVWDAHTQWYNLGLALDISPDTLDSIELANLGKPDHCFRAMLTKWLREHQQPTWNALAEAVRSPSVGLHHLAEEIQRQPTSSTNEKEKLTSEVGHTCPICLEVLRDPYQATCCGKNFCKECIHPVKAANEPCPTCRKRDFHLFPDKRLQQVLYNVRVDCTHKNEGCEWMGERRELDKHLSDAHSGEPPWANSRPGTTKLEGKVDQTMVQPPQPITGTYTPVDAELTMDNFDKHKRDKDTWYSPHFYTHPNGYKMCLRVDANGSASGQGTHLSVFVCLMQGEFDDQLKWPFRGNITIKLVNQKKDRDHVIETFYSSSAGERCERVMTTERINNGWGVGQFLPHAELQPKYLKKNCIKFCINKIDLY